MIFPVRSDRPMRSTPWVNYTLIGANVVIFLLTYSQIQQVDALLMTGRDASQVWVYSYYLHVQDTRLYQFFSYMFLHVGWLHIIGNMVFLLAFGNNVEDRLGKLGYLGFYLAGGVVAGLGNIAMAGFPIIGGSGGSVLGASGAVCAVTGAYLALFPKTHITLVYWWFILGSFEVSARDLIIFFVIIDTVLNVIGLSNVAYTAHLSGYAFGFGVMMLILWIRVLPREPYDMLAVMAQYRRRRAFRAMTEEGYSPWESSEPSRSSPVRISKAMDPDKPLTEEQQKLMSMRTHVSQAIHNHDMPEAARRYLKLLELDDQQVMSQQHQLDLANQLMSDGDYRHAAQAYELLLKHNRGYRDRAHVHLILSLIYIRYLNQKQRASELLDDHTIGQLSESDAELAKQLVNEVRA